MDEEELKRRKAVLRDLGESTFRHIAPQLNVAYPHRTREEFDQICVALGLMAYHLMGKDRFLLEE
jgi:hypothetical protein